MFDTLPPPPAPIQPPPDVVERSWPPQPHAPMAPPSPPVAAAPSQPPVAAAPLPPVEAAPQPVVAPLPPNRVDPADGVTLPPMRPPVPIPEERGGLAAVLAGAGLEGVQVTPELAENFGQILRVVVAGVMDVLRARQQIKDEFRMRVTRFKPKENNPLKFSANVSDALHNLLVKRNEAYFGPVQAFDDAFDDLRDHQLALLAGMRVAFEFMLAEFDPARLQEHFDRQVKRGSVLGMPAKMRYWDLYREQYQEAAKDPEASFRKLFGEAFAKAYEEQLGLLKGRRDDKH
jgi:type VI secretion system FHA domain protein